MDSAGQWKHSIHRDADCYTIYTVKLMESYTPQNSVCVRVNVTFKQPHQVNLQ